MWAVLPNIQFSGFPGNFGQMSLFDSRSMQNITKLVMYMQDMLL